MHSFLAPNMVRDSKRFNLKEGYRGAYVIDKLGQRKFLHPRLCARFLVNPHKSLLYCRFTPIMSIFYVNKLAMQNIAEYTNFYISVDDPRAVWDVENALMRAKIKTNF